MDMSTPMIPPRPMSARRSPSPASEEGQRYLHSITRLLREKDEEVESLQEDLENLASQYERDKALWNEKEKESSQLKLDNKFLCEENRTLKAMVENDREEFNLLKEEKLHLESIFQETEKRFQQERETLEDKLRLLELDLKSTQDELALTIQSANERHDATLAVLEERESRIKEKEREIGKSQKYLQKSEESICNLKGDLKELKGKFESFKSENAKAKTRLKHQNEHLTKEVRGLREEIKSTTEAAAAKLSEEQDRCRKLSAELAEFQIIGEKMVSLEKRVLARDESMSITLHQAKTKLAATEEELEDMRNKCSESVATSASLVEKLDSLEEDLNHLRSKVPSAIALAKLAAALASEVGKINLSYEFISLVAAAGRLSTDLQEVFLDLEPSGSMCTAADLLLVEQGCEQILSGSWLPLENTRTTSQPRRKPFVEHDGNAISLEKRYQEAKDVTVKLCTPDDHPFPRVGKETKGDGPDL